MHFCLNLVSDGLPVNFAGLRIVNRVMRYRIIFSFCYPIVSISKFWNFANASYSVHTILTLRNDSVSPYASRRKVAPTAAIEWMYL